jgi:hypothetical protein
MTVQTISSNELRWWSVYLNNHLTGATAGTRLARRLADGVDGQARKEAERVAHEIAEDREALLGIMAQLRIRPAGRYALVGLLAERAGRLKPNGRLLRRSPLRPLAECEAMLLGVQGKLQGWKALEAARPYLEVRTDLSALQARAAAQLAFLERLHQDLAGDLSGPPGPKGGV